MRLSADTVARISADGVGNSHEAAAQDMVGGVATLQELAMLLEMMRRERDHFKVSRRSGVPPLDCVLIASPQSRLSRLPSLITVSA